MVYKMQSIEVTRLLSLVQAADNILLLGNDDTTIRNRLAAFTDKNIVFQVEPSAKYDLVILNTTNSAAITNAINRVADDAYIYVVSYGINSIHDRTINDFIETNIRFIQSSRQMIVDGARQKHLFLKIDKNKTFISNRTDEITIFLVLKTGGGVYDHRYVNATAQNIKNRITYPHEIVCLTDDATGITEVDRIVKLQHNWPKWWGKVELFRKDITNNKHCLFIDLDTVISDNIDDICKLEGDFFGIRDFYNFSTLQTGLLKWEVGTASNIIYEKFLDVDFSKYINKGDHEWIGQVVQEYNYIQDCLPGAICSYKKHLSHISKGLLFPKIICFHGDPRPHTITHDFITKHWKIEKWQR